MRYDISSVIAYSMFVTEVVSGKLILLTFNTFHVSRGIHKRLICVSSKTLFN